jgi:hypothetical protein
LKRAAAFGASSPVVANYVIGPLAIFTTRNPPYIPAVSKEQVKAILDRVLTWPDERQEDAASILRLMEAQDDGAYQFSVEQAEEIRRRLAGTDAETVTLEQFNDHIRQRLGE